MADRSLPPAQPSYILRGHSAQIHTLAFIQSNSRLVSGDADGWIVIWKMATKRPAAVWKAHGNAILATEAWGHRRLLTHGRDHRMLVWQFGEEEENSMDTMLPIDKPDVHRKQPWLLHSINVNTLNFCSFSVCRAEDRWENAIDDMSDSHDTLHPILVAVPNTLNSDSIDIIHLPSEHRVETVPALNATKTGMVMAVRVFHQAGLLTVAAGYESGHTALHQRNSKSGEWKSLYACQPHTQPVLSLDISPSSQCFFTSSADDIIARHPLPSGPEVELEPKPLELAQTKHSGQQGLQVRSDGRTFATAGWDGRVRVYSTKTTREVAVLKWHKEGCYAVAFASIKPRDTQRAERVRTLVTQDPQMGAAQNNQLQLRPIPSTRDRKAETTHWLAVGSKDGKISLWNIY